MYPSPKLLPTKSIITSVHDDPLLHNIYIDIYTDIDQIRVVQLRISRCGKEKLRLLFI